MGIKLSNNANATLAASITSSATSITVTSGQGARFPTLSAGDYFYATLIDTSNNLEIVKCTARSTDVLTVTRAQEGTTARAYSTGDRIEIRLTAATFTDAVNEIGPTQVSDEANSSTGYFDLPKGTTAQRPVSPTNGMIRYNTTTNSNEIYQNGAWAAFSFNYQADFVLVAGGGGGGGGKSGDGSPGGGGAGGYLAQNSVTMISGTAYAVTIGSGGAGGPGVSQGNGSNGSNSTFYSLTAIGGGAGHGQDGNAGNSGGSGGGGAGGGTPVAGAGGAGTAGQGNAGGYGVTNPYAGGGGGGAGAAGGNASGSTNGAGGVGLNWQSLGTYYAGGGGAGINNYGASTPGAGGTGGGGAGSSSGSSAGVSGSANTGGGGGGGAGISGLSTSGGSGGSGVLVIRYVGTQKGSGGTVTSAGGYTYHTFTSSGTFTA